MARNTRFSTALATTTIGAVAVFALLSGSPARSQTAASSNPAETTFKTDCSMCHGPDGSGTPLGKRMGAPDLRSKAVQTLTPDAMTKIVTSGKGNMPAFGTRLTSAQISQVIAYVRKFHPAAAAGQ